MKCERIRNGSAIQTVQKQDKATASPDIERINVRTVTNLILMMNEWLFVSLNPPEM
jgi:hypothetical protein